MIEDEAARARRFQELVLPHLDDAYNLARWLTRHPEDAEDAVQDAYLRAYRSFETFRGGNARAWILAIVRNACWTSLEQKRRHAAEPLLPERPGDADGEPEKDELRDADRPDPEAALARKNEDAALRRLVAALPLPFREALILREMAELSYREIAEATATPVGTVMSRLARARLLLRQAWTKFSGEEGSA